MTPQQEMVITLFQKEVTEQAKKLAKSATSVCQIDKFSMPFRLFKVNESTVNLELCIRRLYGPVKMNATGAQVRSSVMFFKPIGIYSIEKGLFSSSLNVIVLKEFEKEYDLLIRIGQLEVKCDVKKLSTRENAVIAAFSMDTIVEARAMSDTNFSANGLDLEIFISNQGYPQSFLEDSYGIRGPIGAYFMSGPTSINPMLEYKALFR